LNVIRRTNQSEIHHDKFDDQRILIYLNKIHSSRAQSVYGAEQGYNNNNNNNNNCSKKINKINK